MISAGLKARGSLIGDVSVLIRLTVLGCVLAGTVEAMDFRFCVAGALEVSDTVVAAKVP